LSKNVKEESKKESSAELANTNNNAQTAININQDSCELLIKVYDTQIKMYVSSSDIKDLQPVFEMIKTKTYNNCLKNKEYKNRFEELENMIK